MCRTLIREKMFEEAKFPIYTVLTTHRPFLNIPMMLFIFLPVYRIANVIIAQLPK